MRVAIYFVLVISFFGWVTSSLQDSHADGIRENLVGVWLFEETGDKVVDSSGTGNNGVFKDGKVDRVKGRFGNALQFTGEGFVEIPDSESLSITETITITAWVQVHASFANQGFISKCDYGADQRSYLVRVDNDKLSFGFTETLAGPWFWVADNDTMEQETWYHVATVYDGENLKIYANGNLVNEKAVQSEIPDATTPLMFGVHGISPGTKFVGVLDDVAIFNAALTEEVIGQIMSNGLAAEFIAVEPLDKAAIAWGEIKTETDKGR